jgi:short-subunit dehydrogenase
MLFLNAGAFKFGDFSKLPPSEIEQIVNLNATHPIYLTKVLLKQILARKTRSAIVTVSSLVTIRPFPGVSAASCTK